MVQKVCRNNPWNSHKPTPDVVHAFSSCKKLCKISNRFVSLFSANFWTVSFLTFVKWYRCVLIFSNFLSFFTFLSRLSVIPAKRFQERFRSAINVFCNRKTELWEETETSWNSCTAIPYGHFASRKFMSKLFSVAWYAQILVRIFDFFSQGVNHIHSVCLRSKIIASKTMLKICESQLFQRLSPGSSWFAL